MKLLLDIGNSRIKAALSAEGRLVKVDFNLGLFHRHRITQLTYASVRMPTRNASIIAAAIEADVKVIEVKTQAEAFGVKCAYDNYHTLGIDRWLAVLGAADLYPDEDVIVVDAGTATTVDFVSADKQHLGGWIIPGLELMTRSITSQTDKVFDEDSTAFAYGPGKTTPQALKYGCMAAQCGIVTQAVNDFDRPARLVLTGGTAPLMLPHLEQYNPDHQELIVFRGLALY
jgi:type III pantothenate kinase